MEINFWDANCCFNIRYRIILAVFSPESKMFGAFNYGPNPKRSWFFFFLWKILHWHFFFKIPWVLVAKSNIYCLLATEWFLIWEWDEAWLHLQFMPSEATASSIGQLPYLLLLPLALIPSTKRCCLDRYKELSALSSSVHPRQSSHV